MIDTDGLASFLAMIMCFLIGGLCLAVAVGGAELVTMIWKETLLEETIEVEVLDKAMTDGESSVRYCILVKGKTSDGVEYCDDHYISKVAYSNIEIGDVLMLEYTRTTQPVFGERVSVKLILPVTE